MPVTKDTRPSDGPPFDGPLDGAQMAQPAGSRATSLHEIAVQYWRIQQLRDELRGLPEEVLNLNSGYTATQLRTAQLPAWQDHIKLAEATIRRVRDYMRYLELRERLDQAKIDLEALLAAAVDDSVVLP